MTWCARIADDADPERWSAVVDTTGPARHRLATSDLVSVADGVQVTTVSRDNAFVRPVMAEEHVGPPLGDLLEPMFLAVGYDIADPTGTEHLGRRCLAVTASLRAVGGGIEQTSETSPSTSWRSIHGGEGLGVALREAAARQPREVRFALDATRFLGPDDAAIAFRVEGDVSMSFEGRALRVEGRWLLERHSVTRLLRMAGASVPPPPAG